jgi:hypothetical protein
VVPAGRAGRASTSRDRNRGWLQVPRRRLVRLQGQLRVLVALLDALRGTPDPVARRTLRRGPSRSRRRRLDHVTAQRHEHGAGAEVPWLDYPRVPRRLRRRFALVGDCSGFRPRLTGPERDCLVCAHKTAHRRWGANSFACPSARWWAVESSDILCAAAQSAWEVMELSSDCPSRWSFGAVSL